MPKTKERNARHWEERKERKRQRRATDPEYNARCAKSQREGNRRRRAKKELHIARTPFPNKYLVWGGVGTYVVIGGNTPSCSCTAFTTGTTVYCSHIARYDLTIRRGEGELYPGVKAIPDNLHELTRNAIYERDPENPIFHKA